MASIRKRPDGVWRARYRDGAGKEHSRHFKRKADAQRWLDEVTASIVTGTYVDPKAGTTTFREYAERWRGIQAHRESTREQVRNHLRLHVYPFIGDTPIRSILPSDLKALVAAIQKPHGGAGRELSAATAATVYRHVSAIFRAAVADRVIAQSPCTKGIAPRPVRAKVSPPSTQDVLAIITHMPPWLRTAVTLAAGTGMRQGEVFGLTVDRLDLMRRTVTVDRQLVAVAGSPPVLGPVKTDSSNRAIPLPQTVVDALVAHLGTFPPGPDGFVFTTLDGRPLRRSRFNERLRAAAVEAGVTPITFHGLRHYYASLLIRHGESVKTVQSRLGHKSAVETLDTYSHLWPDSDDRTREAVEVALAPRADSLRTLVVGE